MFDKLPSEIQEKIAFCLDTKTLGLFTQVSKATHKITESNSVWKNQVTENLTTTPKLEENQTYQQFYQTTITRLLKLSQNIKEKHDYISIAKCKLVAAAQLGLEKYVEFLINQENIDIGTNLFFDKTNNIFITPLHFAVSNESLEIIELLLQYKANVHITNRQGPTVLELVNTKQNENLHHLFRKYGYETEFIFEATTSKKKTC